MSNKRNSRNTNKTLTALKRKRYQVGGPADGRKKNKGTKNPWDDSHLPAGGSGGTDDNDAGGSGTEETNPDGVDNGSGTQNSQGTVRSGSIEVGTSGINMSTYPYPADPNNITRPEQAKITAWNAANAANSSGPPLGVKVTGPEVTLDKMEAETILDADGNVPTGTVTDKDDVQKLAALTAEQKATAGTPVTATTGAADQADTSQATTAVAPSRLNQYASQAIGNLKVEGKDRQALETWIKLIAEKGYNRENSKAFPKGLEKYKSQIHNRIVEAGSFDNYDAPIKGDFDDQAETYDATTVAGQMDKTDAAQITDPITAAKAGGTEGQASSTDVKEVTRTKEELAKFKGEAAKRVTTEEGKEYATGATDTDGPVTIDSTISEPDVTSASEVVIDDAKIKELTALAAERKVDAKVVIQEYKDSIASREEQIGIAAEKGYTPRLGETPEEMWARAIYYGADFSDEAPQTEIDDVPAFIKAATRKAEVGKAAERIAAELGNVPSADLEGRKAITGEAPQGTAAEIGGVPTMAAAEMQAVKGEERKVGAADMMAVVADLPEDITAAISEDPATVKAQIDSDPDPVTVAAIAALPVEALVSTQMEGLLAGMEGGKTPLWARPAVDAVNQMMAARGLTSSSVGRDALFNAIIQSALPMAQGNATALQQRAQQNLSNEQQANLSTAQNTMQLRMQNLANRQTAASQTAQMAQEIKVQQGAFNQQAVMGSAQQTQETRMANAQMAQQRAQQESSQQQQAAISTLNVNAQMDLANLQAESNRSGKQMDADQQAKLSTYNAQVSKVMRTAELKQDMEKANLSMSLQVEMQRVSEMNAASKDTMTATNKERLVNLQTLVDFRKTDANFAQQMDIANMTNEQQMELANLTERAATDTANFTADNQFKLQELNNIVARSTRQAELNSRMEEVNLDASLKVELAELSEKNTTERANMTAEQQTRLANLNVLVDFRKTNAAMAQQMDVANLANEQQMELANLQDRSATDAANFTEKNRGRLQELNTSVQVLSQNQQLLQNADMAKLSMQEKIELANLTSKRQADLATMSAENVQQLQVYEKKMQAGQVNAQLAQQFGLAELSNKQSAAMFNAQINANLDMSEFSGEQQMALANSQFMQSMTATQFSAEQQSAIQNATMATQTDLTNADARTRVSVENAKNFLTIDMANLSNRQQGVVMDQQIKQQSLLSDQSAQNAAKQFGATSQNQLDSFLISQSNNMKQFNASARNAMASFNTTETNRKSAIDAGNTLQADTFTAQLAADINKFNVGIDQQRDTWNAANAQAVEQSNVTWRRQANSVDTAAANAANQQNVQNAYNISALDQTQYWQQLRDEAAYVRQSYENNEQRKAQLLATAIGNEASAEKNKTSVSVLTAIADKYFGG